MAKKKPMTMAEAAHRILQKADKKLHYREIMERALSNEMVSTTGKTPEQSLRSLMATEYKKKGSLSRFKPKGKGFYELTAHGKKNSPAQAAKASQSKVKSRGKIRKRRGKKSK